MVVLGIVFLTLTMLAPRLLAGKLSEPVAQECINNTQWLLYDCQRNPITRLGCIIPGTGGKSLTKKRIAVQVSPCRPPVGSTNFSGSRVVSFVWQQQGEAGPCSSSTSSGEGGDCCLYNGTCSQQVSFLCMSTGQNPGGENQCLPAFLPVPFPDFDPNTDYQDPANEFTLQVPCRSNFC